MTPPGLKNPFQGEKPRSADAAKFVEQVSGKDEAEAMREVVGGVDVVEKGDIGEDFEMSEGELKHVDRLEQSPKEETLMRLESWFRHLGYGKELLKQAFVVDSNGIAVAPSTLGIFEGKGIKLTRFPRNMQFVFEGQLDLGRNDIKTLDWIPGYVEINSSLHLGRNPLENLRGLPREIHGTLSLEGCKKLKNLHGLKKHVIHGDLNLKYMSVTKIPESLVVHGKVFIDPSQMELEADALKKNFNVAEF